MATAAVLCLLSVPAALAAPVYNAQDLVVDLGYGIYQGAHNETTGLNAWKGIRYAAAPIGDLRWRAPSVPAVSRAVVNATTYGTRCPQAGPFNLFGQLDSPSGDEDCLFLNVWAPAVEEGKNLPVLVWIHGGGYGGGSGDLDMSHIVTANDNSFVAVTLQYRLGAFGFLSSAEVEKNGVVNAGILDLAFALQWVQDHISRFGGDVSRVTITGESAGAGATMLLGTAKNGTLGSSLFRGIISASPYLPPQYDFDAPIPTERYESFASHAGCGNSTDTLACLRSKDTVTLQSANIDVNAANFYGTWAFLPVTEPETGFVTTLPSESLFAKRVNGEHLLVGNNANEGPLFVPPINSTDSLRTWLQGAYPYLESTDIDAILAVYPESNVTDTALYATTGLGPVTALDVSQYGAGVQQRAYNLYAEATFVCPAYWMNSAYTRNNRTSHHYQYSVPAALHGDDPNAYFGPAQPNQPDIFTTVFRQIWGGFVRAAKPATAQGISNLTWPAWADDGESRMINLNTTGGVPYQSPQMNGVNVTEFMMPGIQNDFSVVDALSWEGGRGARCDFWKTLASKMSV
ncbi:Alpha/Beta hydrolase protein [Boeremia exigua]|uniref:Alpha/Beta hydrolase protein n=1 Tax=Boeremia exigua TaxID=749465 RepID=UPI001E8D53A7|nr:Alpha/Beta hydrolase protein [Boeremia exigua]KAH6642520.1 Alpha/Beta hydrolase protein [Boeremia exigua]